METFNDRQKQLNDQLVIIEKSLNKHNNHKSSHVPKLEDLSVNSYSRQRIRGFRGKQSIFKRPEGPAPRTNLRTIPDYRRNPTKWTCYSLDDVSDMSNESNSEAAFSFLNDLKKRKREQSQKTQFKKKKVEDFSIQNNDDDDHMDVDEKINEEDQSKGTISFRKPHKKKEVSNNECKPEYRGNTVIMPEYEVGTKKVTKKKKSQKTMEKVDKNKEMKLDHLQIQDDDE